MADISELELIRLQMAMAFGQGAGAMIPNHAALRRLVTEQSLLAERAARSWSASRWPFLELMRLLGQISAAHAAAQPSSEIQWPHIEKALPAVMAICPCFGPDPS